MKQITNFLEESSSLTEALDKYICFLESEYEKTLDLKIMEKITAVKFYNKSIHNKKLISTHRNEFNGLYTALEKGLPSMNFNLDGNKKALKSFIEKLEKLQSENKSIDSIYKDIHRFRLTITNSNVDNKEMVDYIEKATIIVIEHFISKGYTLCKPDELKEVLDRNDSIAVAQFKEKHPDVFLPDDTTIPETFATRVKNYVMTPKENGYQGIHLFFSDDKNNLFEVQIRTFAMHIRSEFGKSSHKKYKSYSKKWDLTKINIPGFKIVEVKDENGKVEHHLLDNVGIILPVETFVRRKTF